MRKNLLPVALVLVALPLVACGSDKPVVLATATKGDAFCKLATETDAAGDALNELTSDATPADLEKALKAAIASAAKAEKKAPKDIIETVKALDEGQRKVLAILEKYDFDFAKAATDEEFVKLSADPKLTAQGDELDTYLNEKCGIAID